MFLFCLKQKRRRGVSLQHPYNKRWSASQWIKQGKHAMKKMKMKKKTWLSAKRGEFPKVLGHSQHVRIPPAAHTYQSDVETVHRLEEDEFFDLEKFSSRGDFLAKVHTYQLYFNLVRPNSHKENLSPWQIIERRAPRSPLELCLLPPVFLDYYLNDSGGYDVHRLPYPSVRGADAMSRRWQLCGAREPRRESPVCQAFRNRGDSTLRRTPPVRSSGVCSLCFPLSAAGQQNGA